MAKKFEHLIIETEDALVSFLETELDLDGVVVFDTETTDLGWDSYLLGIALYDGKTRPAYVAVENPFLKGVPLNIVQKHLNKVLPTLKTVAHNAKYDLFVFKNNGLKDPIIIADSLLMVYVYNPDVKKKLETRIKEDFHVNKMTYEEIIGKKWNRIDWDKDTKISIDKKTGENNPPLVTNSNMGKYSCEDVFWTYQLYKYYEGKLEKEELSKIHLNIEVPNTYALRDMKCRGVCIDVPFLQSMEVRITEDISRLRESIYELAQCEFNINSGKQLGEVLFDRLKLPVVGFTKGGARATDKNTLEELSGEYEICEKLMEYSTLNKLLTGYIAAIPNIVDTDGRLRCDFNSDGAATGRLSSSSPNLQNQPNNDKYPVRQAFIPAPGYKFVVLDWSQIELRVMAHVSKDEKMVDAFLNDLDIHGKVAEDLAITRKQSKVINFGVLYGMGEGKLAQTLGVSKPEAAYIIHNYHNTYGGFASWKRYIEGYVSKNGYVKNIFGRVRKLPAARSGSSFEYFKALRQAVNTVIQGSAADLMKLGINKLHRTFIDKKLDAHLLLVVHDEFVIEVREDQAQEVYTLAQHIMENIVPLRVPIKADGKICNNWAEMKSDNILIKDLTYLDYLLYGINQGY